MISTIQGRFTDGAHCTVILCYRLHFCSDSELPILDNKHLFDNSYPSEVVDDEKSWFIQMEVLDVIYYQSFFPANSLGHQLTTSQYFQPLAPLTLALAAAAIHCVRSEYASGKKATVVFSQDEYWGTFCPSPVINCTREATALINYTFVGCLIPPLLCNSASIGAPQSPLTLLSLHWHSSLSFRSQFLSFQHSSAGIGTP